MHLSSYNFVCFLWLSINIAFLLTSQLLAGIQVIGSHQGAHSLLSCDVLCCMCCRYCWGLQPLYLKKTKKKNNTNVRACPSYLCISTNRCANICDRPVTAVRLVLIYIIQIFICLFYSILLCFKTCWWLCQRSETAAGFCRGSGSQFGRPTDYPTSLSLSLSVCSNVWPTKSSLTQISICSHNSTSKLVRCVAPVELLLSLKITFSY